MTDSIYVDNNLKYPLTIEEYKDINKVWKFLKRFKKPYVYLTDYRNYLINKISDKYTQEDFYYYESIVNKMFWNLRHKLNVDKYCSKVSFTDSIDLDKKLHYIISAIGTYYRSFINKLVIIDKEKKKIYYKKMEGSSDIFDDTSDFNLLALTILFDRDLYEEIMSNPIDKKRLKKIVLPQYYYQLDYAFPNINCCKYSIGTKEDKLNRIDKMYYGDDGKYWFKLIM